jgi:hypothetical protein
MRFYYNPVTTAVPSKLTTNLGVAPAAALNLAPVPPSPRNSTSTTVKIYSFSVPLI